MGWTCCLNSETPFPGPPTGLINTRRWRGTTTASPSLTVRERGEGGREGRGGREGCRKGGMQKGTEREARERRTKKDKDRQQLATDVIHRCLLGNPLMPIASLQRHNFHPGIVRRCFTEHE